MLREGNIQLCPFFIEKCYQKMFWHVKSVIPNPKTDGSLQVQHTELIVVVACILHNFI